MSPDVEHDEDELACEEEPYEDDVPSIGVGFYDESENVEEDD
jgi:hypothetical protein